MQDRRLWSAIAAALISPVILFMLLNGWWIENPSDDLELTPPGDMKLPIIAGYFINWGIYDRNYNVIDLAHDAHKLSHVLYCFANLDVNGTIVLGDPWADTDKRFPANLTVDRLEDKDNSGQGLHGNLRQLYLLKQKYRQLKVSLSVGGWSWSSNFSAVASNAERRARFASSAVELVGNLGLDGLDIDWEFPKNGVDAAGYVELLKETREALDLYQKETAISSRMLLSVAMPCGPENFKTLHLEAMDTHVDIFYLMAYDFAGAWDATTGHQAPLYNGIDQAVQYYTDRVQRQKVVLGLPLYGRAFSDTDGLNAPFKGVPKGSWEEGAFDYKDLPRKNAIEYYDNEKGASWSYDADRREWITYDTPQAVQAKCHYISSKGLGGAMFWELSADYKGEHPRSLLDTVYNCFGGLVEVTRNELQYPLSSFDNVLH